MNVVLFELSQVLVLVIVFDQVFSINMQLYEKVILKKAYWVIWYEGGDFHSFEWKSRKLTSVQSFVAYVVDSRLMKENSQPIWKFKSSPRSVGVAGVEIWKW